MPGGAVSVAITANTAGFTAGMSKVSASAKTAAGSVKGAFSDSSLGLGKVGSSIDKGFAGITKHKQSIRTLSSGLLGIGVTAGIGVGMAVKRFAEFDQAMSNVKATGSDAAANMDALRDAALKAGATTAFSATEAAQGVEALAKAGVSAKDTLAGGLTGSLNLAAAGNLGVAGSAEAAASAMNQFGLAGKDIPHIADLLAQAAGTAQGEVSDMAAALNQSGLVANQFGLSIDETTQALALFGKNGLVGSDAGTSFKTMLTSLYAPAGAGAKALETLGVSAYDASGNIKDIAPLTDDLKAKLDALSQGDRNKAMRDIFGSDAIRAGSILLKDGSAGLAQMSTEFGKFGTAADVAKTKMDNLNGDLENLSGSLETAFIGAGSGGNDFLRGLAQGATGAVNAFNGLDAATQGTALKITAVIAGAALAAGGLARLVIGIAATRTALLTLGVSATGARTALAGLSGAGLLAVAGFVAAAAASAALGDQLEKNSAGIEGYKTALVEASDASLNGDLAKFGDSFALLGQGVDDTSSAFAALADTQNVVSQGFRKFGDFIGFTSTAGALAEEFDKIDQALVQMDPDKAAAAFSRLSDQARAAGLSTEQINSTFDDYKKKQEEAASSSGAAASALRSSEIAFKNSTAAVQGGAAAFRDYGPAIDASLAALSAIDPAIKRTADQSAKLAGSLFAQGDAFQNTVSASSAYQESVDAANKVLDKNGVYVNKSKTALKDGAAAGRENIGVLNNLASSGKAYVQSLITQGAGAETAARATNKVRGSFIAAAKDAGLGGDAARKLADAYGLIPSKVSTTVEAFGLAIQDEKVKAFKTTLNSLPAEQRSRILSIFDKKGAVAAQIALEAIKDKQVIVRSKGDLKGANEVKSAMAALKDRLVQAKSRGDTAGAKKLQAAMAALKDRQVIARSKGDLKGASQVKSAMAALKDRLVKAISRGDTSGATKIKAAMAALHDKTVTARVQQSGAGAAQAAINAIHGKTVVITTVHNVRKATVATGGMVTDHGVLYASSGGPVWGAGSATSDSIPAMLSNGEFVINARSVSMIGANRLDHINKTGTMPGFANGGAVGLAVGGIVSSIPKGVDINRIYALIVALTRPLAAVQSTQTLFTRATAALARENRELAAARRAARSGGTTKAEKANLTKQAEQQKAATEKLTEATKNLRDAQQAVADAARAKSATLSDPYRSKSNDVDDWLEAMKQGAVDLKGFQGQLSKLRKLGVSETIVQQIADKGAIAGGEVAQQIIAGGKALSNALNTANGNLQKAADGLGYDVVQATGRYAAGGFVSGPGSAVSDSINARLSNGEYVMNARATSLNRSVLDAMNYGRSSQQSFLPAYAHGGYVHNANKEIRGGDLNVENVYVVDPDEFLRKGRRSLQDSLNAASLRI